MKRSARTMSYGKLAIAPLLVLFACACGGANGGGGLTVIIQPQTQLASGVTVIESSCYAGAQEQCNGLDDNCNGAIDEGCGYSSGQLQITLAWNTGADIDIYVTDPNGDTINYSSTTSSSGGELDHDARGTCGDGSGAATVENVFWRNAPPRGTYKIELRYWSGAECSTNAGPTATTLSIAYGGRIIGAYNYTIVPEQSIAVANFQL